MRKYRISWISKITGYGGHGAYCLDCDKARYIAKKMNKRHDKILHYADPIN